MKNAKHRGIYITARNIKNAGIIESGGSAKIIAENYSGGGNISVKRDKSLSGKWYKRVEIQAAIIIGVATIVAAVIGILE